MLSALRSSFFTIRRAVAVTPRLVCNWGKWARRVQESAHQVYLVRDYLLLHQQKLDGISLGPKKTYFSHVFPHREPVVQVWNLRRLDCYRCLSTSVLHTCPVRRGWDTRSRGTTVTLGESGEEVYSMAVSIVWSCCCYQFNGTFGRCLKTEARTFGAPHPTPFHF